MRNANGTIDWNATEEHAATMGVSALQGAIEDIQATIPFADELDRSDPNANGNQRGGYYRDVASVYHRELAKHGWKQTCGSDGKPTWVDFRENGGQ